MHRHIHSPQGFTLIELLVVISIIGLLSSMIIPLVIDALSRADTTNEVNNIKQVMNSYISDRGESRQTWAMPRGNDGFHQGNSGFPQIDGADCHASGIDVTNVSLFTLAARQELHPDLFTTRSNAGCIDGIANGERLSEAEWTAAIIADWTSPVSGSLSETDLPFALDWSAPKSSGTARITLAMRDPYAYENIPVVFADAHSGSVSAHPITGEIVNTIVTPLNEDGASKGTAIPDNIYTPDGDIPVPSSGPALPRHLWLGRGDKLRTHVK